MRGAPSRVTRRQSDSPNGVEVATQSVGTPSRALERSSSETSPRSVRASCGLHYSAEPGGDPGRGLAPVGLRPAWPRTRTSPRLMLCGVRVESDIPNRLRLFGPDDPIQLAEEVDPKKAPATKGPAYRYAPTGVIYELARHRTTHSTRRGIRTGVW